MAVNTLLLDFRLPSGHSYTQQEIENIVLNGFEEQPKFGANSLLRIFNDGESLSVFKGPLMSLVTLRLYDIRNLVTVTIEYFLPPGHEPLLSYNECKTLEKKWSTGSKQVKTVKTLPRVLRGTSFDVYFPTSDERLVEYDVEEICFDAHSKFQHVQIFKTKSFGNMLVLDDDPNLAESDTLYTDSLIRQGIEDYRNKEILILGGGDGALLCELLKENPKKVTMLEIDVAVMEACKTHLRSLCGNVLDELTGPNYEIMTSNCLPIMRDMLECGIRFDYVFGDLTTIPVTSDNDVASNDIQIFTSDVLDLAFHLLRPGGKFMTHGTGTSGPESAAVLENLMHSKCQPGHSSIEISKKTVFIPSFSENWSFYVVQFVNKLK